MRGNDGHRPREHGVPAFEHSVQHQPSERMSARPLAFADALIEARRNERITTQHLAQLGQSRSRLVDRNRHGGGASAAAGGAEQNHEAPQSQGAPQAPNTLCAMTAATSPLPPRKSAGVDLG